MHPNWFGFLCSRKRAKLIRYVISLFLFSIFQKKKNFFLYFSLFKRAFWWWNFLEKSIFQKYYICVVILYRNAYVCSWHRRLSVRRFFFKIFRKENFENVFLKTALFHLALIDFSKLLHRLTLNFDSLLFRYVTMAPIRIRPINYYSTML